MSTETETYIAELEAAEAQAAGLLDGPDGEGLDQRAGAVIRQLRAATKRHRAVVDRIRHEARTEARQELIRERQTEAGFRRLAARPSARALFGDVDPADEQAMAARSDELREAGVTWPGQPQPPAPPLPDPNFLVPRPRRPSRSKASSSTSTSCWSTLTATLRHAPGGSSGRTTSRPKTPSMSPRRSMPRSSTSTPLMSP